MKSHRYYNELAKLILPVRALWGRVIFIYTLIEERNQIAVQNMYPGRINAINPLCIFMSYLSCYESRVCSG
ncbi:hypothetical protein D3C80_1478560 [compost metagenome]